MKKASAITMSIFIMMIVLGALLAYTAYFIDQVTLRPVVQMQDAELDLKCFLVLSNLIRSSYLRESESVPSSSLREDLIDLYQLSSVAKTELSNTNELLRNSLLSQYGKSEVVLADETIFWTTVGESLPLECYMRVYGPVSIGNAGLFTRLEGSNISVADRMKAVQCNIFKNTHSDEVLMGCQ